jgi:parvulin-like peptidyl-prolyl isomerase
MSLRGTMRRWSVRLSAVSLACASAVVAATAGDTIIAKGGTIELGANDVRALVDSLPESSRTAVSADRSALEQLVRSELVRRAVSAEAKAKNFEQDPATVRALQRIREEAVMRLWLASQATVPSGYPSDAQILAAYDASRSSLTAPTQYHVAQIFISAPDGSDSTKLAAALHKAVDLQGKIGTSDFAQLARAQSENAESASKGGDLGFVSEDHLLPVIAAAVHGMKVGEVIGPVKTPQGLHFLKLIEKKDGTVPTLAEARERIVAALRARRAEELQQAYLKDLGTKLSITINQIELAKLQPGLR